MNIDLSTMKHKELEALAHDVQKAMKDAQERDRAAARQAAEKAAAEFGFSLEEIAPGMNGKKAKGAKAPAKYANPADATQTWTGKGRQPNWYRDLIAKGTSPDDLLI